MNTLMSTTEMQHYAQLANAHTLLQDMLIPQRACTLLSILLPALLTSNA